MKVVPIPKPRGESLSEDELRISGRTARRNAVKKAAEEKATAEKEKRLEEKKRSKEAKEEEGQNKKKKKEQERDVAEEIEAPVKCYGEEIDPDWEEGKRRLKGFISAPCLWNDCHMTVELQVDCSVLLA